MPLYLRHGHGNTAENRGNPAEMPREVNFLAIARGFCVNGNLNPDCMVCGDSVMYRTVIPDITGIQRASALYCISE